MSFVETYIQFIGYHRMLLFTIQLFPTVNQTFK